MPIEKVCRVCKTVRPPPIEGPCPTCGGYVRCVPKRRRGGMDEDDMPQGPMPVAALLDQDPKATKRRPTGLHGVDHVFGGGLPDTGTVLFCAREGTGKTSLLVEVCLHLRIRSLLLSTEQSKQELIDQFARFGAERIRASKHMFVESATEMDDILDIIEEVRPKVLALDSLHDIEGVSDDNGNPLTGSGERAVTRAAKVLCRLAREQKFFAFLVGHMTNEGTMMGGAHLRHAVGSVLGLYRFKEDVDSDPRRILRFQGKTRYGPLGRQALFRMTDKGFTDEGPILSDEDKAKLAAIEAEQAAAKKTPARPGQKPAPAGPRKPRRDGQIIPFPAGAAPATDEPPEPPAA